MLYTSYVTSYVVNAVAPIFIARFTLNFRLILVALFSSSCRSTCVYPTYKMADFDWQATLAAVTAVS